MTKEHVFPKWLINRTGTNATGIRWFTRMRIPALNATIPLCGDCNSQFGRLLENPARRIFDDVESERGLSDPEMEILIRWMWKIKGLFWCATHPNQEYNQKYSLRDRVLLPIDEIRPDLVFAACLYESACPEYGDLPMGVDSTTEVDAIFVSGVFSKIAMMVVAKPLQGCIPQQFEKYNLDDNCSDSNSKKVLFPPTTFKDDTEAVGITHEVSVALSIAHDQLMINTINALQE